MRSRSPVACRHGQAASISSGVNLCNPPVHRHVVDLDPTLGQQLLHVPIREAITQVPADL